MSSSSDIEKLFDHFGGDASAYQEIGRENEARSARTRWPLLVTLDLTQPAIPAIGQRREVAGEALAQEAAPEVDRQDMTPKDAASVTRAKAPLFTRSHRRDIPPVAVAAQPGAPRGASRFGAFQTKGDAAAPIDAVTPVAAQPAAAVAQAQVTPVATAPIPPVMPAVSIPPVAQLRTPAMPVAQPTASMPPAAVMPRAEIPALTPRATAPAPFSASTPTWAQAPAPVPAWTQAPAQAHTPAWAPAPAPSYTTAPAAPKPPASILGKLFAPASEPTPPQPAAPTGESAPLRSVFDRLRGTPAQTAPAPVRAPSVAAPAPSNSWLVNGPRRS
ncbi:cellulose biosynthesis protein BcsP [Paraburkholderia aspalathi]|uniref:cellulose biosynthesis protein BcsP n=1 Tax=Paraburkholderia aspalathi TaxID=1324617 RepID=UPI0038B916EA